MDIQAFKERVFAVGRAAGLEDMEVYMSSSKNFLVRVFKEEVDDYKASVEQGVGFRASFAGKVGYAYVETLDEDSVQILVDGAKANAQVIESSDEIEFFAGAENYPEVVSYNHELAAISPQEKIAFAKDLEKEAFAADKRVSMVNWAMNGYGETEIYIANTKGLEQSFKRNGAYSYVSAVVRDGEQVKTGGRMIFANDWTKFNAKESAQEAVMEATSLLGAASVDSGTYRVLLRFDVAGTLLQTFASVFSAEAVQKGLSLLQGKLGGQIASPLITVVDDPLLENGAASTPFDAEGVPTQRKNVIEAGRLNTYLYNLKTAKKDGVSSTGNASRASYKSPVGIAPTNFFVQPGESSYEELVETLGDGIVIIDVQGTHSGANTVSGDFSLSAYGYFVENGKITRPVDQITIAGNFFELLESVEAVGADLMFVNPGSAGNVGSPSLIISHLAIAGI
ncbi:MAG: TldD/PmbA family protein [Firmicutes bacterium]|nr:TldD/PmbA family protein [Bacillota bacterium]